MFKHSVSFTYKGNETISSSVGTIATILIVGVTITYLGFFLRKMFSYSEVSWSKNTKTSLSTEEFYLMDFKHINFGISWLKREYAEEGEAHHLNEYVNIMSIYQNSINQLEMFRCQNKPNVTYDEYSDEIELCTDYPPFELRSRMDLNGVVSPGQFLQILMSPWDEETYDIAEGGQWFYYPSAETFLHGSMIRLLFDNTLIDLDNIENPLITSPSEYLMRYEWNYVSTFTFKIRKNEVFLEDSLFPLFLQSEKKIFYSVEIDQKGIESSDYLGGEMGVVKIEIVLDNFVDQYRRKVLNIFEVLGFVGGIFEILEVSAGLIVGIISYFMIKSEINENLKVADEKFLSLRKAFKNIPSTGNCWSWTWNHNYLPKEEEKSNIRNPIYKQKLLDEHENYPTQTNYSEGKDRFDIFKSELNCIEVVYTLKELKEKVNYLLEKDKDYIEASKVNPDLKFDPDTLMNYNTPALRNNKVFSHEQKLSSHNLSLSNKRMIQRKNGLTHSPLRRNGLPSNEPRPNQNHRMNTLKRMSYYQIQKDQEHV